jgi:LysM repeat protein
MAIAGVLVAAPAAANAATSASARPATVAEQIHTDALVTRTASIKPASTAKPASKTESASKAKSGSRTYVVESGDSLASIAQRFYGNDNDWTWIYQANKAEIGNPNSIYPGEHLQIPATASGTPVSSSSNGHTAKHAKSDPPATTLTTSAIPSGTLDCSGLETLWEDAGGSSGEAVMAASIAMAESGGQQFALSPTDDYGYWQINAVHGSLATFNALGNAKAAIDISSDGTNWSPWTTYTSGAYYGRC